MAKQVKKPTKGKLSTSSGAGNDGTPKDRLDTVEIDEEEPSKETHSHHSHHSRHKHAKERKVVQRKLYQSRRVVFVLGALLGLAITVFFSTYHNENIKIEVDKLIKFDSINDYFEDWKDILPSSIQGILLDFEGEKEPLHGSAESFSVGKRMVSMYNLTDEYNVVMVPGVISTGIESWGLLSTGDCPSLPHFRKRLWGSFYMLRTMVLDKACWLKHIMLDPETGLDPPNIKLRAAQGFEAADFFMAGYWIWNKILQNLAVIGYGPNNMISAGYDWRLAYLDLEVRDAYFSKLKAHIELTKKLTGKKSMLVGHSMGSQVIFYFMKWAEAKGEMYGNGGPNWCNEYIAAFINVSGTMLGTPKTIPAVISGEMKDTVQLNQLAVYGLEKFFSRKERVDMLQSFGGIPSMLPKGGAVIWGDLESAPDDPPSERGSGHLDGEEREASLGSFVRYRGKKWGAKDFSISDSIDFLMEHSPGWFSDRIRKQYSFGIAKTAGELAANNNDHLKWSNPLEVALPNAPDMKIYNFYGVGILTERAYTYTDAEKGVDLLMTIDTDSEHPVYFAEGDGTVSLLTHSICHEWQKNDSRFNPANIEVKVVEIKHEPDRFDIRGGAKTADHVDILGSAELNELILKVAAGKGHTIENRYMSFLKDYVAKMEI